MLFASSHRLATAYARRVATMRLPRNEDMKGMPNFRRVEQEDEQVANNSCRKCFSHGEVLSNVVANWRRHLVRKSGSTAELALVLGGFLRLRDDRDGPVAALGRRPDEPAAFTTVIVDVRQLARCVQQTRRQVLTTRAGDGGQRRGL